MMSYSVECKFFKSKLWWHLKDKWSQGMEKRRNPTPERQVIRNQESRIQEETHPPQLVADRRHPLYGLNSTTTTHGKELIAFSCEAPLFVALKPLHPITLTWSRNDLRSLTTTLLTSHSLATTAQPERCSIDALASYLVDPASSHMLVSKIKPCTFQYQPITVKSRIAHYNSHCFLDLTFLLG
jgi:hypothetical protein